MQKLKRRSPGVIPRPYRLPAIKVTDGEKEDAFNKAEAHGIGVSELVRRAINAFPDRPVSHG